MITEVTKDILCVGAVDRNIDLFEGQYIVPDGISYNSYIIKAEKTAVTDTVDAAFGDEWLADIREVLGGKSPDYLVIHHMEPDHSANIRKFADTYPETKIVSSAKAFTMMKNFFGTDFSDRKVVAAEGTVLDLGGHSLTFVTAPMVHWPEVLMSYDSTDKVIFSADAFGRFGSPEKDKPWDDEARRYYIGIVGKYGAQVQALLKKAAKLDIAVICPLHGPVLDENIAHYVGLYDKWSSYTPEDKGIIIAYASVYGNTKAAALLLEEKLKARGCANVAVYDLARCDKAQAVADAFRYDRLVLASPTYNADVFPCMREYLAALTERNFCGRKVAFIENGSWAPMAAKVMKAAFEKSKEITFAETSVKINSAVNDDVKAAVEKLADELCG